MTSHYKHITSPRQLTYVTEHLFYVAGKKLQSNTMVDLHCSFTDMGRVRKTCMLVVLGTIKRKLLQWSWNVHLQPQLQQNRRSCLIVVVVKCRFDLNYCPFYDIPSFQLQSCAPRQLLKAKEYYRNTIAGLPPSERIFIFFEKIRFASQKWISQFCFFAKILVKMTLNSLEVTKCCKN